MDTPAPQPLTFATVTPLALSSAVTDGDVTLRVRRIGPEVQIAVEVDTLHRASAATLTLPRIAPDVAMELAKLLLEAATGQSVELTGFPAEGI